MSALTSLSATTAADTARAPKAPGKTRDPAEAAKAAQDFEAVFISQMFQPMFKGLKTDGLFGGGQGEEMFRSLLVDEYGKMLSARGGIGIADAVQREILKLQEK